MPISIDMLSVGDADAIVVWLKTDTYNRTICIDGGNASDGEKVIKHFEAYIKPHTGKGPDLIISTHTDNDHINGLKTIVEKYSSDILQVWIHDPRNHAYSFDDSMQSGVDLIKEIDKLGIERREPFTDVGFVLDSISVQVVSPTVAFYQEMIEENYIIPPVSLANILFEMDEGEDCPSVDKKNKTSSANNTSVILKVTDGIEKYLFTGDAGVQALNNAHNMFDISNLKWLQVPHHGSKRNLSSELIGIMKPNICYISAKGDRKHPSRAIINCLTKNSTVGIYSTHKNKKTINYTSDNSGFPVREGWIALESL